MIEVWPLDHASVVRVAKGGQLNGTHGCLSGQPLLAQPSDSSWTLRTPTQRPDDMGTITCRGEVGIGTSDDPGTLDKLCARKSRKKRLTVLRGVPRFTYGSEKLDGAVG